MLLLAGCAAHLPACYSRIHHPDCPYNLEMKEAVRHEREIVIVVVVVAECILAREREGERERER